MFQRMFNKMQNRKTELYEVEASWDVKFTLHKQKLTNFGFVVQFYTGNTRQGDNLHIFCNDGKVTTEFL